jgi:hypothetical protein
MMLEGIALTIGKGIKSLNPGKEVKPAIITYSDAAFNKRFTQFEEGR